MENGTNGTVCDSVEAVLHRKILGTIIFLVIWPFIVLDMKWFPLGRPATALLGATLMVIFTVVPQCQAYYVIGDLGSLQTLFLLLGMMLMAYYYDREGLLRRVALWIFGNRKSFSRVLWKVCVLSAVLSAIITNDATCLVLTPLFLNEHVKQKRSKKELPALLIGIATSANIGSASTFFGNPQNAYIAANADISLILFFATSLPAAIMGLALSIGLLYLIYFKVIFRYQPSDVEQPNASNSLQINCNTHADYQGTAQIERSMMSLSASRQELARGFDQSLDPYLSSQIAEERRRLYGSDSRLSKSGPMSSRGNLFTQSLPTNVRPLVNISNCHEPLPHTLPQVEELSTDDVITQLQEEEEGTSLGDDQSTHVNHPSENGQLHTQQIQEEASQVTKNRGWRDRYENILTKCFIIWLIVITIVMIGLLAVPPLPSVKFNLGLVPMGAAILTMLADTILKGKYAYDAMTSVDWTVLLLFGGIFVWLQGFQNTGFTEEIFKRMKNAMNLSKVQGVLLFTVFVIIASNILSNVPLVVLLSVQLDKFVCSDSKNGLCSSQLSGLLLAWVSTIAGNFTLIGSVANLIVAEKARNTVGFRLTFWEYLKFGFVSTLIVLFSGLPIVYFTSKYIDI